jgi:DNA polymerase-1
MGAGKLAAALKVDYMVAKVMRESYMKALPRSTDWMRKVMNYAEKNKQMENIYGRVYYFDDSYYKAINYCIQGSCSEIIKRAMINCNEYLKKRNKKSSLLLSVHDELVFEVHESEIEEGLGVPLDLRRIMENVYAPYRLSLTAKVSIKEKNWNK